VSTWIVDVNALTIGAPFPGWGAQPSMATVHFRTTLGVPNSTQVWVDKPYQQVCVGAGAGTTCPVGDGVGRSTFANVPRPTLPEIWTGQRPLVFGTVQYVTDASAPGDAAAIPLEMLRTGLSFGEQLDFQSLATGFKIGSSAGWTLNLFQAGIFGFGGPRPARVTAMVAVDPSLEEQVNLGLLANRDRLFATAAAAVSTRTVVQPYELAVGSWYVTSARISQ
jgi:hypothetical protein